MPHINTLPGQHDHTVSMFIIRTDQGEPKIMFHLHKKYRVYMQFGGHIELNENPWQAVARELKEEVGYDLNQLEILQPKQTIKKLSGVITHPLPVVYTTHHAAPQHYHSDVAFALITDQEERHPIAEIESSDIKLFTKNELIKLPKEKTYENGREITLFILDKALKTWHRMPAATWPSG